MSASKDGLFTKKTPVATDQPAIAPSTVDEFFSKRLNSIRADTDTKRGNCLSCACETARALTHPQSYVPKVINDDNADKYERTAIREAKSDSSTPETAKKVKKTFQATEKNNEIAELLTFLDKEAKPGSIFITDTEDHVYVLFKSYKDRLYLLDSDAHYYSQINDEKDFKVPFEIFHGYRDLPPTGLYHDYVFDNEGGEVELTLFGLADPSWDKVLEPLEHSKSALHMSVNKK